MSRANAVRNRTVSARVRHAGSSVPFSPRTFHLMLGVDNDVKADTTEVKRILRQLGYDVAAGPVEMLS